MKSTFTMIELIICNSNYRYISGSTATSDDTKITSIGWKNYRALDLEGFVRSGRYTIDYNQKYL